MFRIKREIVLLFCALITSSGVLFSVLGSTFKKTLASAQTHSEMGDQDFEATSNEDILKYLKLKIL